MESLLTLQKRINSAYYKKKGGAIYDDFLTFVSRCDKLATANARDFSKYLSENPGIEKARVLETGVGDGSFALNFLKELERTGDISRVEYILCDFSEKMLSDAQKKLSDFKDVVSTRTVDFSDMASVSALGSSLSGDVHYLRMNELLTDLPAQVFVRKADRIFEVLYDFSGKENSPIKKSVAQATAPESVSKFLSHPSLEDYEIPFNFVALSSIMELRKLLAPGGYIDIFDYGFATLDSIVDMPQDMWNENIVREYGGQLTTDLNFVLIAAGGNAAGLDSAIDLQTDYVSDALKQEIIPLMLDDGLYYFTREEAEKKKKELVKEGYDLNELFDREVIADDGFWHLRFKSEE